jgi:type-F conjugative transfer system pilin assembly protein TrbC
MLRFLTGIVLSVAIVIDALPVWSGMREIYIDVPTFCHKVEKVEGNAIALRSGKGPCVQAIGKIPVRIDEAVRRVRIYVDGEFWQEREIADFGLSGIRDALTRAEKDREEMNIPENAHRKEMNTRAGELAAYYQSEEFQKKLQTETERIQRDVFGMNDSANPYADAEKTESGGKLPQDERIYILISSSIPLQTIRNYVRDVAALADPNILIVMRGFVNGMKKIKPTLEFIRKAVSVDPGCDFLRNKCEVHAAGIQIDPLIFRRYGADAVPAFVYARNVRIIDPAMSAGSGENASAGDIVMLKGDVSLEYALEVFSRETESPALTHLIRRTKSGLYR